MIDIEIVQFSSFIFFLFELVLMIVKRSKKDGYKVRSDKKSLVLLWITIPVSLTLGFLAANYQKWNITNQSIAFLGLAIYLSGFIIRLVSIRQLKHGFTVDVVVADNHKLKTDGLYKYIRHPSYLGLLLICFGLSVAMNSIFSLSVVIVPVFLALTYRIKIEESILTKEFGETYLNYMSGTCRMIPNVY